MNKFIKLTVKRKFKENYEILIAQEEIAYVMPNEDTGENGTDVVLKNSKIFSVAENLAYFEDHLL